MDAAVGQLEREAPPSSGGALWRRLTRGPVLALALLSLLAAVLVPPVAESGLRLAGLSRLGIDDTIVGSVSRDGAPRRYTVRRSVLREGLETCLVSLNASGPRPC